MDAAAALSLAQRLHEGQVDKVGSPYWQHLDRVAGHLTRMFPDASSAEVQAAYLHDAIEDTSATEAELLAVGVEPKAIAIVKRLTRDPTLSYMDWIQAIAASGDIGAIRVKLADNADNSDPARAHPDRDRMLAERYVPARAILTQALSGQ